MANAYKFDYTMTQKNATKISVDELVHAVVRNGASAEDLLCKLIDTLVDKNVLDQSDLGNLFSPTTPGFGWGLQDPTE